MFGTSLSENDAEVVDRTKAALILDAAWERGVNFIDTANVYGGGRSEECAKVLLTGLLQDTKGGAQ